MRFSKTNRFIGSILLVSGTTIGAGMLALPVTTGLSGFWPACALMIAIWLYMLLTAYYLLEVNLGLKGESNLITMMKKTLGKGGEIVSWVTYLLLLYALLAAYMVGCSQIVADLVSSFGLSLPSWSYPVLIFVIFGAFIYFGTEVADMLNRALILGLCLGYVALIGFGLSYIDSDLLMHSNWNLMAASIPVVLTSFGYHIIIPTLTTYLQHDAKLLKRAIFIGSAIPLAVYLLWQLLAIGVIPLEGDLSLTNAASKGLQATIFLKEIIGSPMVSIAARTFAFFAIVTSLLGVSLSLKDFLADGLKIKKTQMGKLSLLLMTFVPPLFFALFYPQGFIMALHYAGIFVVVLLALLPSMMVWSERYGRGRTKFSHTGFRVWGGQAGVALSIAISLFLLILVVVL
jgi:tyrosine-specific transport protein